MGVSPDGAASHREFREANALPFYLIPDPDRDLIRLYGVRRRFGLGTSRCTYVIDKLGIIRRVVHNELAMSSHVKAALKTLDALQAAPNAAL